MLTLDRGASGLPHLLGASLRSNTVHHLSAVGVMFVMIAQCMDPTRAYLRYAQWTVCLHPGDDKMLINLYVQYVSASSK